MLMPKGSKIEVVIYQSVSIGQVIETMVRLANMPDNEIVQEFSKEINAVLRHFQE